MSEEKAGTSPTAPAAKPTSGRWFGLAIGAVVLGFVFYVPVKRERVNSGVDLEKLFQSEQVDVLARLHGLDALRNAGILRKQPGRETSYTTWEVLFGGAGTTRVIEPEERPRTSPRFQIVERQNQVAAEKVFLIDHDAGQVFIMYHDPAKDVPWWGLMSRGTVDATAKKPK